MEKIEDRSNMLLVNIKKKAFGNNIIIKDLFLSIKEGEYVSIIGRSGIGKSSLLKIMAGLDSEYDGSIIFNQTSIYEPTKNICLMFQGHVLLPWLRVKDNIRFINSNISNETINSYLKSVGMIDKENSWPNRLSGGEKTRVGLSIALINRSKLLLLDEPFSDIDIGVKNGVTKLLNDIKIKNNTTTIITTHNIEDALTLTERVLVLGGNPSTIVLDSKISSENTQELRDKIYSILAPKDT